MLGLQFRLTASGDHPRAAHRSAAGRPCLVIPTLIEVTEGSAPEQPEPAPALMLGLVVQHVATLAERLEVQRAGTVCPRHDSRPLRDCLSGRGARRFAGHAPSARQSILFGDDAMSQHAIVETLLDPSNARRSALNRKLSPPIAWWSGGCD